MSPVRSPAARLAAGALLLLAGCSLLFPAGYKLRTAEKLEAAGKFAEAAAAYEEIAAKYRNKPQALTALSRAAAIHEERLGNWRKAAALLQDLRTLTEGKPGAPEVLLRLAHVLEQSGSPYRDALQTYGVICKECASAPETVTALLSQGRIYEAMQMWADAKRVYEETIEKMGGSPCADTVRARLQSVWLLEALGTYTAGQLAEGVQLAETALKSATSPEVRNGLEDLLRRYQVARSLWRSAPGRIFFPNTEITAEADPSQYPVRAERGQVQPAPAGWELAFDGGKKRFRLTEKTPGPADPRKKPWTFRSPPATLILGFFWSPDSKYAGWIGKTRAGSEREIRVLDLKSRRSWQVICDLKGLQLGETVIFMPHSDKLVFPVGRFLAISDLHGRNRVQFLVRSDTKLGAVFRARDVEWQALSADGVSLAIAVRQPKPKAAGSGGAPLMACWKFNLSTNLVLGD